jgi:hypothetical protein
MNRIIADAWQYKAGGPSPQYQARAQDFKTHNS